MRACSSAPASWFPVEESDRSNAINGIHDLIGWQIPGAKSRAKGNRVDSMLHSLLTTTTEHDGASCPATTATTARPARRRCGDDAARCTAFPGQEDDRLAPARPTLRWSPLASTVTPAVSHGECHVAIGSGALGNARPRYTVAATSSRMAVARSLVRRRLGPLRATGAF